jgi:hypothetical protein
MTNTVAGDVCPDGAAYVDLRAMTEEEARASNVETKRGDLK